MESGKEDEQHVSGTRSGIPPAAIGPSSSTKATPKEGTKKRRVSIADTVTFNDENSSSFVSGHKMKFGGYKIASSISKNQSQQQEQQALKFDHPSYDSKIQSEVSENYQPRAQASSSSSNNIESSSVAVVDQANNLHCCYKKWVDFIILGSVFILIIITFIGYILILNMKTPDDGSDSGSSEDFYGFVPMPNVNKTIENFQFDENSNKTIQIRDFFMQCSYEDGADRLKYSCVQLDKHFILKNPNGVNEIDNGSD